MSTESLVEPYGIPTTYHGIRFRSRLEAAWAVFFDLCQWPWRYEPFDLAGYIPDFVLVFPHGDVVVEVKPELHLQALQQYVQKIEKSGWGKEALIVGSGPLWDGHAWVMGWLSERVSVDDGECAFEWGKAMAMTCLRCGACSFYHDYMTWTCRVHGCWSGDDYLGIWQDIALMWNEAQNMVQWKGRHEDEDL